MEIQELLPDAPYITDEMIAEMSRKQLSQYLFYRKHKTHVDCFCTSCQKRYQVRRDGREEYPTDEKRNIFVRSIAHNNDVNCLECGAKVTCKSEGMSRRGLKQTEPLTYFCIHNGKVYAFCGWLENRFGSQEKSIEALGDNYSVTWYYSYAVEYAPQSVRLFSKNYAGIWKESSKLYEPWYGSNIYGNVGYFRMHNPEALQDSFLKYLIPKKQSYKPLLYFMYAAKYPAFEMLEKLGGRNIIDDILNGRSFKSALNLSGKSCAEVFRTDSNEAALIRQNISRVSIGTLQCLRKLKFIAKKQGRKYKLEDAIMICKKTESYDCVLKLITATALTPQKLLNYIDKQIKLQKRYICFPFENIIRDYADYIDECKELGYNIKDDQICHPKDLYEAHRRTSSALNEIIREREEKAELERTTAYLNGVYTEYVDKYEYYGRRYCIIVPKSAAEIVEEGRCQHHCVAGYAARHIEGKLTILFMREVANKELALYTIEMRGNELKQIRGLKNCAPNEEAMKFVNKWLKWVKLPENKKHSENKKTA